MTLSDPATGLSSVIMPRDGVTAMSLDVQPAVRAVEEDHVGGGGSADTTQYLSSAAATLTMRLWQGSGGQLPEAFMDEIGALLNPAKRCTLVCSNDQWAADRRLTVRFDSKTVPVDQPWPLDMAIGWKVPAGVWEAAATSSATLNPTLTGGPGLRFQVSPTPIGLHVSHASGFDWPAAPVGADTIVAVAGNQPCWWTAQLYGPCTGPKISNDSYGLDLIFADTLSLGSGEFVAIDAQARTAFRNGDPTQSVLPLLDFVNSGWWQLQTGTNLLRYHPTSASGGSSAIVTYRPAWL